jgi:CheY-like chemotaxis protein
VEAHRGTIAASSDGENRGTTFTVTLPTVSAPAPAQPSVPAGDARAKAQDGGRAPVRILLVEDQADARRALAVLLTRTGHEVRAAADAAEALAIAREYAYDLLLSDLGLPDVSGLELIGRLKAIRPVPAIALTGLGMADDVRAALAAGFAAHLTKPIQFPRLQSLIDSLASSPR